MNRPRTTSRLDRRRILKATGAAVGTGLVAPNLIFRHGAGAQDAPLGTISLPNVRAYEGVTINLAVQKHTATDAIQELTPNFEEQTGITVNFEQIPQQQMDQKQRTDLATGTGSYDVMGWFLNPEYVENDWIFPVEELRADAASTDEALLALDDFYPPFLGWNTYQDVLYGLPFYGESIMMYYNTEEFERAGIAAAPNTVEELDAACQAIMEGGRMAGIALRASQEGNAAIYPFLGWLRGYGGNWVNLETMEIELATPESIQAASEWGRFLRDYGPADVASYFWNEVQLAMQQETAAIIMDATNFGPRLEDPAQSKVVGKVGYAPLPMAMGPDGPLGPEQCDGRFGHPAIAYGLSVPRTAKNPQAAWLFIQWATSPDVMLETIETGLRGDPTRRSTLESERFSELYNFGDGAWAEVLSQTFGYGLEDYWPREVVTNPQLADILGLSLSQVVTGERSAEEALTDAATQSTEVQRQAGLLQ